MTIKTTKPKNKKVTKAKSINEDILSVCSKDLAWTRERALELAIDIFKQPAFIKEANAYTIVNLADTFSTFITKGKDAAFPAPAVASPS